MIDYLENRFEGYFLAAEKQRFEKCNNCDEKGYFHYVSPQGKKRSEICNCRRYKMIWKPCLLKLQKIVIKNEIILVYSWNRDKRKVILYTGQSPEEIPNYLKTYIIFDKKEDCQRFCDYYNEKNPPYQPIFDASFDGELF